MELWIKSETVCRYWVFAIVMAFSNWSESIQQTVWLDEYASIERGQLSLPPAANPPPPEVPAYGSEKIVALHGGAVMHGIVGEVKTASDIDG